MGDGMPGRLLRAGAPSPNPAAPRSFPRPRRAKPHPCDPLPRPGRGASPRRGARAALCELCTPPPLRQTAGAARGWGWEASAPAFPTPPTQGCGGGGPGAVREQGGCGGWDWLLVATRQRGVGRAPPVLCGGGSRSFHCTAQGGGGNLVGGGRYKYLQIVSSGTGGGEGSALGCKWEWCCLSWGAVRSRDGSQPAPVA